MKSIYSNALTSTELNQKGTKFVAEWEICGSLIPLKGTLRQL